MNGAKKIDYKDIHIEKVLNSKNKIIGYRATIWVNENDKITSPIFQSKNKMSNWINDKLNSLTNSLVMPEKQH